MKTTLFWKLHFSSFTTETHAFDKNKQCHMTLEGLSGVCPKLEPGNPKYNEILEVNVLQKFTTNATAHISNFKLSIKNRHVSSVLIT